MSRQAMAQSEAAGPASSGHRRAVAMVLLGLLLLLLIPSLARADYRIESGDVLEISVLGAAGLHRRATVDAAGRISMLLLGDIPAAGLTLPELRDKIGALLVAKNVVRNPEVSIEISEYRPVYVGGDVMKPGAYPYRISMNVRDAVALAEGYDLLHLRGHDLMLEGADARGQYNGSGIELAKEIVHVARIRAELAGATQFDASSLKDLPVSPSVLSEIIQAERQQLDVSNEDTARQKAYLGRMLAEAKDRVAALTAAVAKSQAAYRQTVDNIARANGLLKRGLIARERVETVQNAAISAQGSLTDVSGRADQARQDVANFTRQSQQVDEQRKAALLQELQRATAAAATARTQLRTAAQKVIYTNAAQQQLSTGTLSNRASIVIYRQSKAGKQQQLHGNETTTLMPGDDVQITSNYDPNDLLRGSHSDGLSRSKGQPAVGPLSQEVGEEAQPDSALLHATSPPHPATRPAGQ